MNLNDARKIIMPVQSASEDSKLHALPRRLFPRTPNLSGNNVEAKREEIRRYFHATLDRYEQLFETLHGDEAIFQKTDFVAPSADLLPGPYLDFLYEQIDTCRADEGADQS